MCGTWVSASVSGDGRTTGDMAVECSAEIRREITFRLGASNCPSSCIIDVLN